jgi:hypothetical protein
VVPARPQLSRDPLGGVEMDKNTYLIELSESDRTDFGRVEFASQSSDQQVFSAIWALESEVNSGGFAHYFSSTEGDTANFAPAALERIGAHRAAAIVREALHVLSPGPLPAGQAARESLIEDLNEAQQDRVSELDSKFYSYPDNLTELLFAFVSERPDLFGPVPEDAA